jgi:hypothetical protein
VVIGVLQKDSDELAEDVAMVRQILSLPIGLTGPGGGRSQVGREGIRNLDGDVRGTPCRERGKQ